MTGKQLPCSDRSRSNNREHRNNSRHRSPNKFSQSHSKSYYGNSNIKPPSRSGSPHPRPPNSQKILTIALDHNHLTIIEMEIVKDDQSHVIDFVTSETISTRFQIKNKQTTQCKTLKMQIHNVSEETLLEQQFNDLLLELNQDNQDEYFKSQEE